MLIHIQVAHSSSVDGCVRFGDYIMLQHDSSHHFLACDPFEDYLPGYDKYAVSGSTESRSIARNTFKIVRPPAKHQNIDDNVYDDDVVRLGQGFCLMINESLLADPHRSTGMHCCCAAELFEVLISFS